LKLDTKCKYIDCVVDFSNYIYSFLIIKIVEIWVSIYK